MKISRLSYLQNVQGSDKQNKEVDKAKGKTEIKDNIEISEASREVRKQIENMKNNTSVDSKKVSEIKTAIENGTYSVSSRDLAGKIMESIREQSLI